MNSHCTHCTLPTIEYYLTCKTCPSSFHYSCLHLSSIISRSWTHLNNPPPAYAIAIFNSTNFSFSYPNCLSIKPFTSPHKLPTSNKNTKPASAISECNTKTESHTTSPSPLALLCSISLTPKLLNIKTSSPRISVNPTIYHNSPPTITHHQLPFNPKSIKLSQPTAYNYKPSSSLHPFPSHNPYHNNYSSTHTYSRVSQLNNLLNENSLIIMHLKSTDLNTEFINTLINHLDIPAKYITKATFTNHYTQIYLINSSIVNIFFQRFLIARKNSKFAHLFIRNNIPFNTRIRGTN